MSQRSGRGVHATMCHVDAVDTLILDLFSRSAATIAGLALFIITTISLMRTVVVPRALSSVVSDAIASSVIRVHRRIARWRKTYEGRDAVLAWCGPMIIIVQLLSWLILYFTAYGLWIYGLGGVDFGEAFRQSGSSLFTLGFASSSGAEPTALDFMAAATGPIVIALLIGFLPTIYSAYIQREVDVSLMGVNGGEPTWGPEFLARITLNNQLAEMPKRFTEWNRWIGNVRLTHVTYPVLMQIRSSTPYRHWVVAALAVMDAAALHLSVTKKEPSPASSQVIIQGTQTFELLYANMAVKKKLRKRIPFVGKYFGVSTPTKNEIQNLPSYHPGTVAVEMAATADSTRKFSAEVINAIRKGEAPELQLPRAEFDNALAMLKEAGYPIEVEGDIAWAQFVLTRRRYEFTAYELCRRLDATPAPWTGPRDIPTPVIKPASAVEILRNEVNSQRIDESKRPAESPDGS